ncbi:glycoside hydrolase domain-containing protein [Micromonospora sp. CPCC 205561]|uniref:glycoside hydrolase domain-containing protein n=1 Tax=Micromonospora sp. CPCC 205561 TaxID=3122407 RepID=UPI002FF3C8F7
MRRPTTRLISLTAAVGLCAALGSAVVAQAAPAQPQPVLAAAVPPQPGNFVGKGFDTCTAPSQAAMDAWRTSSPYRAVGIYISGASRSCAQPNLTATWVSNQTSKGWRLIPIELGYQAPCGNRAPKMSADPATARSQGRGAADSAANAAQALGIGAGSTIYNDIEHYPTTTACRAAVLSFVSGWVDRLHARGYLAGMYSSGSSGIRDVCLEYNNPSYTRLDQIWIAWWNGVADTDAGAYCSDAYYANHQRLHQYAGDVRETWGGVTMNIDRNYLDVATGQQPPPPPPQQWTTTVDNATSGRFVAGANWSTSSYSGSRYGADYRFAEPTQSSDVAWYRADIPETGSYEISVWYPADPGYNNQTPYVVATTSGNKSVMVDQRLNGGRWTSIGVFTLAAGDGNKIGVSRWTAGSGYVVADAVRITRN